MNNLAICEEFFAPVASDLIDGLIGQYRSDLIKIERIAEIVNSEFSGLMKFFLDGNKDDYARYSSISAERLFRTEGAIAALSAHYWQKTLAMTDVIDCMPQKRRDEWFKSIQDMTTPDYTEDAVRPTIASMLLMRAQFLSERVDGIFRNLSGEHVTNSPAAFGKRMIISYMASYHGDKTGYINDLRCVIAKFMGRDEPKYGVSARLVESLKYDTGVWHTVDGGALRIRLYKKGTAHLEIHPEMAWRLNSILAMLYPHAIPAEFRTKPKKRAKEFDMMLRPLPFAVLEILSDARPRRTEKTVSLSFTAKQNTPAAWAEACRVLESIGGVAEAPGDYQFDYQPSDVLNEIINSGCLPDQKTHQFYPTPEIIARRVIELAEIGETDTCLEPSAGQGGLAGLMPTDRTVCVELSSLHCRILEQKKFKVVEGDFLKIKTFDDPTGKTPWLEFDRIVMNPPFSDGRWKLHLEHAYSFLENGGRLVAVLPASAKNKPLLPGCTWHDTYDGEFSGTSVSVALLVVNKL